MKKSPGPRGARNGELLVPSLLAYLFTAVYRATRLGLDMLVMILFYQGVRAEYE